MAGSKNRIFSGIACFSPSVPRRTQSMWVALGGTLAQTPDTRRRANWYFCNGMQDRWLPELAGRSVVVFHADWVIKAAELGFSGPTGEFVLDDAFKPDAYTQAALKHASSSRIFSRDAQTLQSTQDLAHTPTSSPLSQHAGSRNDLSVSRSRSFNVSGTTLVDMSLSQDFSQSLINEAISSPYSSHTSAPTDFKADKENVPPAQQLMKPRTRRLVELREADATADQPLKPTLPRHISLAYFPASSISADQPVQKRPRLSGSRSAAPLTASVNVKAVQKFSTAFVGLRNSETDSDGDREEPHTFRVRFETPDERRAPAPACPPGSMKDDLDLAREASLRFRDLLDSAQSASAPASTPRVAIADVLSTLSDLPTAHTAHVVPGYAVLGKKFTINKKGRGKKISRVRGLTAEHVV